MATTPDPVQGDITPVVAVEALAGKGVVEAQTVLPKVAEVSSDAKKGMKVTVTAYTSTPAQTDDTPFITASGTHTRPGVAASNVLAFGTKFKLPKLFGDRIFTVEDRMNAKYNGKNIVDIWFNDEDAATVFGKRTATMEIL